MNSVKIDKSVRINIIAPVQEQKNINVKRKSFLSRRSNLSPVGRLDHDKRRGSSPSMRKFKSQDKINSMKTSEGDTVCTHSNNDCKTSNPFLSNCSKSNDKTVVNSNNESGRIWLESSFVMEVSENDEKSVGSK